MSERWIGLAVGLLVMFGLALADPVSVPEPPSDKASSFALIALADTRPLLVRVNAVLDGKPLHEAWDAFLDDAFRTLDRNGDGSLDEKEAADIRPTVFAAGLSPVVQFRRLDADRDGVLSRQEFFQWMNRQFPGGVRLQASRAGADEFNTESDALFDRLDLNGDGKLDGNEIRRVPESLSRLDFNEDEVVTFAEIQQFLGRVPLSAEDAPSGQERRPRLRRELPLYLVSRNDPVAEWVPEMLSRYTGPQSNRLRSRRLSRDQFKISPTAFTLLDQDKDGELDSEELRRFADIPADVVTELRFDTTKRQSTMGHRPGSDDVKVVSQPNAVVLVLGKSRVEITIANGQRLLTADQLATVNREMARRRFVDLDQDRNGYLTSEEALTFSDFREFFAEMDADGDGKLFEKELEAWLDRHLPLISKAMSAHVVVRVNESSGGMLHWLDANRDGRITPREMRNAVQTLLRVMDRDGLGKAAMPVVVHLEIGPATGMREHAGFSAGSEDATPLSAPLWFRRMDRNLDGDVSPQEFLGPAAKFREIDADGDGLISAEEAARYDARHRPVK